MISSYQNSSISMGGVVSFSVVVLGVFFSVFASGITFSGLEIGSLILLGVTYIFIGIYIFSLASRYTLSWLRLLYFSCQILLASGISIIAKGSPAALLIFIPLMGQSVILLSPRMMLVINSGFLFIYAMIGRAFSHAWSEVISNLPIFFAGQVFVILFMQMQQEENLANIRIKSLVSELEEANQILREQASQAELLAMLKERNRLAREIHDGLGHHLTVLHMQIQAAIAIILSNPSQALKTMQKASSQAQDALVDVRQSVSTLRAQDDIRQPLGRRVELLAESAKTPKLDIQVSVKGYYREAPAHIELALYRIIQEGIQNAIKHSNASLLIISMDYTNQKYIGLSLSDNGSGVDVFGIGYGLTGMQERINLLGGKIHYGNLPEKGFGVFIEVPV